MASYISIETTTVITVTENKLSVKVSVTNRGDEPAHNIQINVSENERKQSSPVKHAIDVDETVDYEPEFDLLQKKDGRYPLVVNVDYTDANQYPFTATSVLLYTFGNDTVTKVHGSADNIALSKHSKINLTLKNMENDVKELHINLVVPKELTVVESARNISLSARSEKVVKFKVNNFTALAGSQYNAFFVVEYEDKIKHYTCLVSSLIEIQAKSSTFKDNKIYIIIGVSILLVILILVQFRKKEKK